MQEVSSTWHSTEPFFAALTHTSEQLQVYIGYSETDVFKI